MEPLERAVHQEQIESNLVATARRHVKRLEHLESGYGFDLDVATDIYGIDLLRHDLPEAQTAVRFWEALSYELKAGRQYIGLLFHRIEPVPGVSGFRSTTPQQLNVRSVIFRDRPRLIMDRDSDGLAFIALRSDEPAYGSEDRQLNLIRQQAEGSLESFDLLRNYHAEVLAADDPLTTAVKLIERINAAGESCAGEGTWLASHAIEEWLIDEQPHNRQ